MLLLMDSYIQIKIGGGKKEAMTKVYGPVNHD